MAAKSSGTRIEKPIDYYSLPRRDILALLPSSNLRRVLEIGCGTGETGELLKKEYGVVFVTGVDIENAAIEVARKKLDDVYLANIEEVDLPLELQSYDLILLGDVVEHLIDPWNVIKKLRLYLRPHGYLLISIPNIQHWRNIVNLILGRWEYSGSGMLDIAHLRFFTKDTILRLLEDAGFCIQMIRGNSGPLSNLLNKFTFGLLSGYLSFRYFILAERSDS
ncbi:MAG TPA: methyltransferase domain-containing protein [bacterium]|nr:methyltransferase domain-containing protein [bacterium]